MSPGLSRLQLPSRKMSRVRFAQNADDCGSTTTEHNQDMAQDRVWHQLTEVHNFSFIVFGFTFTSILNAMTSTVCPASTGVWLTDSNIHLR